MRIFSRKQPQATARSVRDEWLAWLELGGARPATVKGYRGTTDRLLNRYPELAMGERRSHEAVALLSVAARTHQHLRAVGIVSDSAATCPKYGGKVCRPEAGALCECYPGKKPSAAYLSGKETP